MMESSVVSGGRTTATNAPGATAATSAPGQRNADDLADLKRGDLLGAYRCMVCSRKLDDKEILLKNQSRIYFQISGAGHEAIQVAAGMVLRPGYDWFHGYYRDRALSLQLGVTPLDMLLAGVGAESDKSNGGRQMPSHWGNKALNIIAGSSATTTQLLHAVGCAEAGQIFARVPGIPDASRRYHADEIVYTSLGEGSTSEGEFWEAVNAACTRQAPVLFLVEDNGYAISTPVEVQTPGGSVSALMRAIPGLFVATVDGTDFLASLRTMREAAAYVRGRQGPALVHAHVTRPYSHSLSDDEKLYKTAAEREDEQRRDPIRKLAAYLIDQGYASTEDLEQIAIDVDREIDEATRTALAATKPARETAGLYVYSPDVDPTSTAFEAVAQTDGKPETMVEAINRTLADEMAVNPHIVMFGEDVADASRSHALNEVKGKGGVFKVTHGLQRRFGGDRVFNSPIAEASIIGRAVGMAMRGLKPVVEIQFFDYIWPAMMQIRNELAMLRYRSGNHFTCPVVVRVPIGGYLRGGGPYHSQSGESIFVHCPGLRVVYPCNAVDAAGLLRTAIRCDDPVLFLEHKHLYRQTYNKGVYPGADYTLPFGRASVLREGSDVVVFTWGALVQRTLLAAQQAEKDGISVAVIDLRSLSPCDWDAIGTWTKRTSRVIIAHEDTLTCGFGAEIAARIAHDHFSDLDAPVRRVAAIDTPVAYCPDLEEAILPQSADVLQAIRDTAAY